MKKNGKIKYEKPISLDAGKVAPIQGQNCSNGTMPADDCISGNDPDVIPQCVATGNIATGNCQGNGVSAGSVCWTYGATAGGCLTGGVPS